jgi:tryptophan-rich hypothetical protein
MFHRIRFMLCWILLADAPRVKAWSMSTFTPQGIYRPSHLVPLQTAVPIITRPSTSIRSRSNSIILMGTRGKKIRKEKRRASKEPTPPQIQTPYGPIRLNRPPRVCDCCNGRGIIRCSVCEGRGVVRETGHRKTNPVKPDHLPQSLWTSVEIYNGHRHHAVMEVLGSRRKNNMQVRMRNCCGEQQDFWISANELRNKEVWRMGWITFNQIIKAQGGPLLDARVCFLCKGDRILECVDCGGVGTIPSYEPLYD